MITFINKSGPFLKTDKIIFQKLNSGQKKYIYDHIGIRYPHKKVQAFLSTNDDISVTIKFGNDAQQIFKLNNGYLEFENIYADSIELQFNCNMPIETTIDVSFYEITNY